MSGKSGDAGKSGYYLIRKNAVPEVLRKVVEVKHLLASGRVRTINQAAAAVGISRSTYYKYADDIEEFHDNSVGTTLTLVAEINDETGLLSEVLKVIAEVTRTFLPFINPFLRTESRLYPSVSRFVKTQKISAV